MADEQAAPTIRTDREQLVLVGKIAVGLVVGFIMAGVVAPIVVAIIFGLADGH